jgi:hypothetical protein
MSGPATMPAGQRILTLAPKGYCSTDPEDHPSLPTQTTGRLDRQLLNGIGVSIYLSYPADRRSAPRSPTVCCKGRKATSVHLALPLRGCIRQ